LIGAKSAFGVGVALAAAATIGAHAVLVAPRRLRVRRRRVLLPRLPRAFHGYRILHLSDFHLGALASGAEHVLAAATLQADLAVVTGDMVESHWHFESCARLLGMLQASDGVVCVHGNHDHAAERHAGLEGALNAALARRGVRMLVNEAAEVRRGMDSLWVVGVDDPYEWRADVALAYRGVPVDACSVLLAHSPDVLVELAYGQADLVLTGHSHGGQVRTPFGPVFTRTRRRFREAMGLQRLDGSQVHMSTGLGSTLPVRFLCPPEVVVLHLLAGEGAACGDAMGEPD
jgi:hypothetical protein